MNKWYIQAAGVLFGILILAVLVFLAGPDEILSVFLNASAVPLLSAVFLYGLSWVFRTIRLKLLVNSSRPAGKIGIFTLFRIHISGYALNSLFPAKLGDLAAIGFLKLKGLRLGHSAAVIVQSRVLDLVSVIILSIPAVFLMPRSSSHSWLVISLMGAAGVLAAIAGFIVFDKKERLSKVLDRKSKSLNSWIFRLIIEKVSQAYAAYKDILFGRTSLFLSTAGMSLSIWILEGMTCICVCVSFSGRWEIPSCILAVAAANVVKSIPVSPGGLGIYETVVAAVLTLSGIPLEMAVSIGLGDHILKKIFNLTVGIPSIPALGMKISDIRESIRLYKKNLENPSAIHS